MLDRLTTATNPNDDVLLGNRQDVFDILAAVDEYGTHEDCRGDGGDAKDACNFCSADAEYGAWVIEHTDKCPVTRARQMLKALGVETYPERMASA